MYMYISKCACLVCVHMYNVQYAWLNNSWINYSLLTCSLLHVYMYILFEFLDVITSNFYDMYMYICVQWNPSIEDTLKWGHPCIKDTYMYICPKGVWNKGIPLYTAHMLHVHVLYMGTCTVLVYMYWSDPYVFFYRTSFRFGGCTPAGYSSNLFSITFWSSGQNLPESTRWSKEVCSCH